MKKRTTILYNVFNHNFNLKTQKFIILFKKKNNDKKDEEKPNFT